MIYILTAPLYVYYWQFVSKMPDIGSKIYYWTTRNIIEEYPGKFTLNFEEADIIYDKNFEPPEGGYFEPPLITRELIEKYGFQSYRDFIMSDKYIPPKESYGLIKICDFEEK